MRIYEHLFSGGLLDALREDAGVEDLVERDFARVTAGERGGQARRHGLAELTEPLGANALENRSEQPPTPVPCEAERPRQDRRARVEAAIDVHLLANRRPVPRVFHGGLAAPNFHGTVYLTSELA